MKVKAAVLGFFDSFLSDQAVNGKTASPEQEVAVSVAAAEEQPRLAAVGPGVLLPLLLPGKETEEQSVS